MALADTLLVDGTNLQTLYGVVIESLDLFAPGGRRGSDDVIPGRHGALGAAGPLEAYNFSVGIAVGPEGAAGAVAATVPGRRFQMLTNLNALAAAVAGTNGLVVLTRRLTSDAAGAYISHTAAGRYGGWTQEPFNAESIRVELAFANLDGAWYAAGAPTVPIVP